MLELRNITYEVDDNNENKEILKNVSVTIDDHFVAITGPNGGGKSTLAKMIAGIIRPTSGQILLDGEDITSLNITERARKGISFAFQQPVHFKGLTVKDLITIAAGKEMSVNEICDILSEVGLCAREYIDREINGSLSGGELKRIEIAMITARGTKLSIFDEPEAGIDLWSFNSLIKVFEKMRDEINGTILIISHQERILDIADKIIVISEDFKKNIMAKGVPEEKIEVIYNWVDEQAVLPVPREQNKLFDRYGLDRSAFYVTYCGNIGLTQNMDMLLQVAKELEVYPDIKFVLIGEGAYKKQVEKVVAEWDLTNVLLLPFQPYEDIAHVFSLGNVGLVISKPGVGENSVPSKTWSILSAARPVLASFDENELKTIIDRNECGVFTRAGDKDSFIQALMKFYHDRDYCHVCGKRGREFILNNLTREVGTSKYLQQRIRKT